VIHFIENAQLLVSGHLTTLRPGGVVVCGKCWLSYYFSWGGWSCFFWFWGHPTPPPPPNPLRHVFFFEWCFFLCFFGGFCCVVCGCVVFVVFLFFVSFFFCSFRPCWSVGCGFSFFILLLQSVVCELFVGFRASGGVCAFLFSGLGGVLSPWVGCVWRAGDRIVVCVGCLCFGFVVWRWGVTGKAAQRVREPSYRHL